MTDDATRIAAIQARRHLRIGYLPVASITHSQEPTVKDDLGEVLAALARLQAENAILTEAARTLAEARTDSAHWQAAREVLFPVGAKR